MAQSLKEWEDQVASRHLARPQQPADPTEPGGMFSIDYATVARAYLNEQESVRLQEEQRRLERERRRQMLYDEASRFGIHDLVRNLSLYGRAIPGMMDSTSDD